MVRPNEVIVTIVTIRIIAIHLLGSEGARHEPEDFALLSCGVLAMDRVKLKSIYPHFLQDEMEVQRS